jgi:hypothetical protein
VVIGLLAIIVVVLCFFVYFLVRKREVVKPVDNTHKKCQFCGEEIGIDAKICKYCGLVTGSSSG